MNSIDSDCDPPLCSYGTQLLHADHVRLNPKKSKYKHVLSADTTLTQIVIHYTLFKKESGERACRNIFVRVVKSQNVVYVTSARDL